MSAEQTAADPPSDQSMVEMNEALLLGSLRQHEMTEAAEHLNGQLRAIMGEREQAEVALRESDERFRAIADNIPQLAWLADGEGQVGWFNQRWLDYTGTTLEENVGAGWKAVHHPDHLEAVAEKFERHLREGLDWEDTFPLRRHDGEFRWFLSRMKVIRDEAGKVVRFFGTNTDVTEWRQAGLLQAAQKEALERAARGAPLLEVLTFLTRTAERQSPAGARMAIHLLDETGAHFTHTAAAALPPGYAANVDGVAVSSAIGTCCASVARRERVVVADIAACAEFPKFAAFALPLGLRAAWSTPIIATSGKVLGTFVCYYAEVREPGPQDDLLGAMVTRTAALVIEREQAAEALRASEARYRSIIESSPDCIKVLDLEGHLLSMEAGQELLGITDLAPLLHKPWVEFWEGGDDRAAARAAITAAAAGGEGKFVGFFRTQHGLDKWWDVAISPVLDAGGEPARLLAVSRDVTERHEMEEMLAARAAELAQADRSKDEFLAMLAHELRNPLAPLRNAAEILQAPGVSAEERAQAQRIIGRQIENMSRMIDDLLDVSRITEGKIELRKKAVSLESILTSATSLARSDCAARGQELALTMPAEPVFLEADATRLEQVFGNLLTNACKYSGNGSHIALTAEVAASKSDRSDQSDRSDRSDHQSQPREVVVSVSDDGAGIAPAMLPRVFDLFVQASRTLDRAHGGLGIGLTLVQRLVKLHHGTIEAHSEGLGHGAQFIVRLPILTEAPPPAPPPPRPAQENPRRILIVDDNTDAARSLAILQTRRGHLTRTAFTGPDAVTAAAEFLPEVVLLDIGLPGMDGFEVARHIRAMPALRGVLLIAMSGYGSPEDRIQARAAGFDEYMVKPADLDQLREWLGTMRRSEPSRA